MNKLAAAFILVAGIMFAEDAPKPTIEQLQAQIAQRDAQIAKLQQKLTIYQQTAFRCQDAMLDAQIDTQQAKQQPQPRPKPEVKP